MQPALCGHSCQARADSPTATGTTIATRAPELPPLSLLWGDGLGEGAGCGAPGLATGTTPGLEGAGEGEGSGSGAGRASVRFVKARLVVVPGLTPATA